MSAAVVAFPRPDAKQSNVVLPQVWATASARLHGKPQAGPIGRAVERVGPGKVVELKPAPAAEAPSPIRAIVPELAFYRKYTEAMLTRYVKLSMASGRVPSLLGRELFQGHVTSYNQVHSFEDVVIFVHDMEKCLARLSGVQRQLIKRVALQGYSQGEAAGLLGIGLATLKRHYGATLDDLTRLLLERGMLEPLTASASK